jgi:hypothetical protein
MCSRTRSRRSLGKILLGASLACLLGLAAGGCTGSGNTTLSQADQAKAKESAKKKFDNSGAKPGRGNAG